MGRLQSSPLRQRLALILANVRDHAIFALDLDRRVVEWNAGAEEILGYRADEIVGQSGDAVFTPEDRAAGVPQQEQDEATANDRAEDERWHLRKSGERFFGSGVMSALRDDAGTLLGFVKVMRDFTERRRQQEALARSESRYRLLVESLKDYAIFTLDPAGHVTSWTAAAERILGYPADEAIGKSLAMFFTPEDRDRGTPARELEIATTRGRAEAEGWRVRRDGTRFWGEETATAMYDDAGRLWGISKVTRGITARRLAEAERDRLLHQATEANRIKDEFLSTISHELRTPLNAIMGWARILRDGGLDDRGRARAIQTVERNAASQAQLIDDLLDVSRIITGKLKVQIQHVDLVDVITSALDAVRPAATAKGVRLISQLDPDVEAMMGDPDRLAQVIWNLLSNAIKFTPAGGEVVISTRRLADEAEITVRDTGAGIAPAFLPFVFDRFRQADSSSTRNQTGLGLGLAIVRHLVELHGGTVSAESAGAGKGAKFHVNLPLTGEVKVAPESLLSPTPVRPPADATSGDHRSLAGLSILAIDDHEDAREPLVRSLEGLGATAIAAASAAEARDILARVEPDVLLVDIAMPDEDGYTFLSRLRTTPALNQERIPAIATTAYARDTDRRRILAAGFDAYIAKPIDLDALYQLIVDVVPKGKT